jgi:hypothetical protein
MKTFPLLLSLSVLLLACTATETAPAGGTPTPTTPTAPRPVNYLVLLDLSDRLLAPGQVSNDTALVGYLFARFNKKVIEKDLIIRSKDRFQVVIAPQQGVSYDPARSMDALSVDLKAAKNAPAKAAAFDWFEHQFNPELRRLYAEATRGRQTPADFAGCDLWRYFNEQLGAALEPDYDNRLVILTDGYLDFNDPHHAICRGHRCTTTNGLMPFLRNRTDWAALIERNEWGLLPLEKRFSNLSVALVELHPKSPNLREAEILKKLWQQWLSEMGIPNLHHIQRFNLTQSKKELDSFFE